MQRLVVLGIAAVLGSVAVSAPLVWPGASSHTESVGDAPAISGSCGTGPTLVGNDTAGKVTTGTGVPSSCVLTFSPPYANAPACTTTNETTANLLRATSTTTTITLAGTMVAGDVLAYICAGYK